ncbi:MAG: hypothetical protein K8I30_19325 [Anaerolineae bacterium]|nr:hypothetical protein [Anaerolineae bacterium]
MKRMFNAVLWVMLLAGCATDMPDLTPTVIVATPTLLPEPIPTLPPLGTTELLLNPNERYGVLIAFAETPPARVTIYEPYPSEKTIVFDLEAQDDDSESPTFATSDQTEGSGWGLPYILHALNTQPGRNTPSSRSIQGTLLLSPDAHRLVFTLCNEHGGRGQWCAESRLWMFDLARSRAQLVKLIDLGVLYIQNLHFNNDGQKVMGDSCIQYANAYFGHCGKSIAMTWEAATGRLLDQSLPTPMNEGLSS